MKNLICYSQRITLGLFIYDSCGLTQPDASQLSFILASLKGWLRNNLINSLTRREGQTAKRPSGMDECSSCHLARPADELLCRLLPSACSSHPASIQKHSLFKPSVQFSLALPLEGDQVSAACIGHPDPPFGGRAIRETGCQTTE